MFSFDVITKDWGTGKIEITGFNRVLSLRPTEIHHKSDGSLDNKPSFCFVLSIPNDTDFCVCGEMSLEMLNKSLGHLGYEIVRKSGESL
jgi:hypothetical protein